MAKSADPSSFLTLQMATVDDEAMEQLSQRLLSENCSITALDLSYNAALGKEGLAALARGLSQNTTVSALNLAGCKGITDRAAADFARTLRVDGKGTCKLSKVNFSGCHLGDQFAKQVGACLEPSYPPAGDVLLGSVNLSGCESLTDEGLVAMVKPLAASPSLNSLDLHGCILLTDSGFAQLAKRLRYNISLEYLDLSWCELLSDLTAQRLAEALEENRALKTLRLACCVALTDGGAISLATALQTNRTLTALDLDSVPSLGRPTMLAFHDILNSTNRTLTKLKLDRGTAATAQLGGAAAAGAAAKEPNAMGEGGAARGAARGASTRAVGTGRDSRAKEPHPTRSPPDSREKAHPARSQATCHRMGEQENGAPVGWYAQQIEKMLLRNSQAHDSAQRDQLTSQLASRRYSTVHTHAGEGDRLRTRANTVVRLDLTSTPLQILHVLELIEMSARTRGLVGIVGLTLLDLTWPDLACLPGEVVRPAPLASIDDQQRCHHVQRRQCRRLPAPIPHDGAAGSELGRRRLRQHRSRVECRAEQDAGRCRRGTCRARADVHNAAQAVGSPRSF